ncbi:hypothetical protein AGLY_013781, partial [Aphis glycines]
GKWVPFCCTLGGGVDLGLGIYDLYYLNNNKYQKSFEAKPLFNVVLKKFKFQTLIKFFCLNPVEKNFYDFPTTKLLANFPNFDIMCSCTCRYEGCSCTDERRRFRPGPPESSAARSKVSVSSKKIVFLPGESDPDRTIPRLRRHMKEIACVAPYRYNPVQCPVPYHYNIFRINSNFKHLKKKIVTNDFGFFFITLRTTYKKPCIKFSRFSGQPKNFYRYLKKKYLEKLKISIFLSYNKKKFDFDKNWFCVKNPVFPSFF